MGTKNSVVLAIILIIFTLSLWILLPVDGERFGRQGMRLGLDLVGGSHLVYQAQFREGASSEEKARDLQRALETIQRRIDKYGVTEPIIQKQEGDRILVQLPGFTDIEAAKRLVEQTGFLEFREVELTDDGTAVYLRDYLEGNRTSFFDKKTAGTRIFADKKGNPVVSLVKSDDGNLRFTDGLGNPIDTSMLDVEVKGYLSWIPARGDDGTLLTGDLLAKAVPSVSEQITGAEAVVSIEWNDEGAIIFDQVAARLFSRPQRSPQRALGIFLDEVRISAPEIIVPEYNGRGVITGSFTVEGVERLANLLEAGALPMPLLKPPLYQEKISATLGADFINRSVTAGVIGIILVMLFMIIYYRLPGVLASLALIFYGALVLALFKLIPVTLTLAGLGGFVLSIGMAVDANVLIFERIKEELRKGRTLGGAIEVGFNRAWTAIRDSNITTFIVCGILYWLGGSIVASAPVQGFALTLFIGVAVSMFTAIVVTRTLLRLCVGTPLAQRTSLFSPYLGRK